MRLPAQTLLACLLIASTTFAQDASDSPPAIQRLEVDSIAVVWKPAKITIYAKMPKDAPQSELVILGGKSSSDERPGRITVDFESDESATDGEAPAATRRLRISGSAEDILAGPYGDSRTIVLSDKEGVPRYAVDLPAPKFVSLRKGTSVSDGIAVDIACEGLLPGFRMLGKVESELGEGKQPPKLAKIWTDDEDGLPRVRLLLPRLDENDAKVTYQLALANGDGSHTKLVALSRTGNELQSQVRKLKDGEATPELDLSTVASSADADSSVARADTASGSGASGESGTGAALREDAGALSPDDRDGASTLAAKPQVDWESKNTELVIELPSAKKGERYRIVQPDADRYPRVNDAVPDVASENGKLVIRGTATSLHDVMVPGTRSLWVAAEDAGDEKIYRVDLPGPTLAGVATAKGEGFKGPALVLSVRGLLPGFDIVYATQPATIDDEEPQPRSREIKVRRKGLGYPRITDISKHSGEARVTIRFSSRSDDSSPMDFFLAVLNPDGSRSRTMKIRQEGRAFGKKGGFDREARPLPVDAEAKVPSLEFLEVSEAIRLAREAGFVPVLFDVATMKEAKGVESDDATVLRQGIEGGDTARQGELLLLGIRLPGSDDSITKVILDDPVGTPLGEPPLDPVGSLGFVPIGIDDTGIDGGLDDTLEDPYDDNFTIPTDDGSLAGIDDFPGDIGDGGPTDVDDGNVPDDTSEDSSGSDVSGNVSDLDTGSIIPVNPDPGVNIDPTTSTPENLAAGILQVVLNALVERLGQGELPGAIGKAITNAVQAHEQELVQSVQSGQPVEQVPVGPLLDEIAKALEIELKPDDKQKALTAWRGFAKNRLHVVHLDENKNGAIADDIAIWFIVWLQKNGLYNPATNVQLADGAVGNTVAVLPNSSISPEWVNGVVAGVLGIIAASGNGSGPATDGNLPNPKPETGDKPGIQIVEEEVTIKIPKGKSKVTAGGPPDEIRVPKELEGKPAADAFKKIKAVGLKPTTDGKLISTDKVVAVKPDQGKWVKPSDDVELSVLRRVPGVLEKSAKYAKEKLEEFELDPEADVDFEIRPDDLVNDQDPKEGEYVKRGAAVELTFKRKVPNVEGKTVEDADKLIRADEFVTKGPESGGVLASDRVVAQKPPHEVDGKAVYGNPGAAIQLVQVATQVPDLTGRSLASAKTLTIAQKMLDAKKLDWELAGRKTDYGEARVYDQTPDGGTYVDRAKTKVQFNVVVPVPKFTARTSIGTAEKQLRERDLVPEVSLDNPRSSDVVMSSSVLRTRTEKLMVGSTEYAAPETKVRLTAGRKVPDVESRTWDSGWSTIQGTGFEPKVATGYSEGSYVYQTSPEGGELGDPRRPVLMYPGEKVDVVDDPLNVAREKIHNVGLRDRVVKVREVETNDHRVGQEVVESQSPKAGELVLRKNTTYIDLTTIRYVKPAPVWVQRPLERVVAISSDIDQDLPEGNALQMLLPYVASEQGGGIAVVPFAKRFAPAESDILKLVRNAGSQFTTKISSAQLLLLFRTNPQPRIPVIDNPKYRAAADAYFKARHGPRGVTTFVPGESFARSQGREEGAGPGTPVDFDVWYTYDYVIRVQQPSTDDLPR